MILEIITAHLVENGLPATYCDYMENKWITVETKEQCQIEIWNRLLEGFVVIVLFQDSRLIEQRCVELVSPAFLDDIATTVERYLAFVPEV